MRSHDWKNLALVAVFALVPTLCSAQIYQGPSGGNGGTSFDNWNDSQHATDISEIKLFIRNSAIRCIRVLYRDSSGTFSGQTSSGGEGGDCRLQDRELKPIPGWIEIPLARDEFIIGIAGRYGARVNSIRFFTNKRNLPEGNGLYGDSGGTADYGYTAPSGQKIAAFIGRSSDNLDALGVLYAPVEPGRNPQPTRSIVWLLSTLLLASLAGFAFMWYRFNKLKKPIPTVSTNG